MKCIPDRVEPVSNINATKMKNGCADEGWVSALVARENATENIADETAQKKPEDIIAGFSNVRGRPGQTILLVEDERFVREAAEAALEASGYEVVAAVSGADALQACGDRLRPPDLLLADLVMPGISGAELVKRYLRLYPRGHAVLMSGYVEEPKLTPFPCRAAYLRKPFSVQSLLKVVRESLDFDPAIGQISA
jgi:CheY-like chemotaxis protein